MTEVEIGGKIPRSIIPDLIGAIQAAGLDLDWNDGEPSEETLRQKLEECNGKETLSVNATELSGGNVDPLDQFCVANNIPFMKRVEGKYELQRRDILVAARHAQDPELGRHGQGS